MTKGYQQLTMVVALLVLYWVDLFGEKGWVC